MIRSVALCCLVATVAHGAPAPPAWSGFAANAQHTAPAPAAAQALTKIHWQTPVDLSPPEQHDSLTIHYAPPMITSTGEILVPLKTTGAGNFELEALSGKAGATLWTLTSDYVLPPNEWTPAFPAQLGNNGRAYIAAAGGTVLSRDKLANANVAAKRIAFYPLKLFRAHAVELTRTVMIDTPITSDAAGDIYFGFVVEGANPAKLKSGIARIGADGTGTWVGAAAAAGDNTITEAAMDSAPAISADGTTIYAAVSNGSAGYLLGLDATTLATKYKVALVDPASGQPSWVADISSASPTIGPDGDVYFGVLENPYPEHNNRGWLLHFDATLATLKTPGSFGWDDTVSIVPASLIPNYKAQGSYLIMSKYNNYLGIGSGDGMNRIAILDPDATQQDEYINQPVTVLKEVQTQLDPTKYKGGGVYEWCINTAVVDANTGAVFAGAEDGNFYRWDLASNTLSQQLNLNAPQSEGYTPTLVGTDGTVFAINNAILYAVGK